MKTAEDKGLRVAVAYYRVSTPRQGQSGLGLEAQRTAVAQYLNGGRWKLLQEFTEVETGKGADALHKRPQLRAALQLCQERKAVLLIAKFDRLARNVHFLTGLLEAGVKFVAVDMPDVNTLTIHVVAAVAQAERDMISQRTKAALAAAKTRGVRLGRAGPRNLRKVKNRHHPYAQAHAERLRMTLSSLRAQGLTQYAIAQELSKLGICTARGKAVWHQPTVARVLFRLGL